MNTPQSSTVKLSQNSYDSPAVRLVDIRLVREASSTYAKVSHFKDAANIVYDMIGDTDKEHFVAVCLNVRHQVTNINIVSIGHLSATIVHPREVFKGAILQNSHAVILAHNHPSGTVSPSPEDLLCCERLQKAGEILGIQVLDFIIVGPTQDYYSKVTEGIRAL